MDAVKNGSTGSDGYDLTWNYRVKLILFENTDNVSIEYLRAMRPLAKQGSLCLSWLTALADEYQTPLAVTPTAQAPHLVKWYSRFDFRAQHNSVVMLREPKALEIITSEIDLQHYS